MSREHVKETEQLRTASGEIITVNKRSTWAKLQPFIEKIPVHLVILFIVVVWLLPTIGLFISSFRPPADIRNTGWWEILDPPVHVTLQNYRTVLSEENIGRAFTNSVMIAVPATAMPILIAAYGLSFAVYLMRNYIDGLPKELFDIAEIDGADNFTVFYRLVLPLTVPALASLAIFQFIWAWNDLLVALVFLGGSPDVAPLTIAISNLVGSRGRGWEVLTAAAFVSIALPLFVFFSLQRYFVRGILAGSVKG